MNIEVHDAMTHRTYPHTKDSNLHKLPNHSVLTYYYINFPNTMGLQIRSYAQKGLDHNSPYMTEFYNDYIIYLNMTFTSNDKYDMYNQDQRPL